MTQVIDACDGVYVFLAAERSEVQRLVDGRLVSARGPFMAAPSPGVSPMVRFGDGSLAVMDREQLHLFDSERWSIRHAPDRLRSVWGNDSMAGCWMICEPDAVVLEHVGSSTIPSRFYTQGNLGWRYVSGLDRRAFVVGDARSTGSVAWTMFSSSWSADGGPPHALDEVHLLARDHVVALGDGRVYVNRSSAWDELALDASGGAPTFVGALGRETIVGGLEPSTGERWAWVQVGRRVRYRVRLDGVDVDPGTPLVLSRLRDGALALVGASRLFISEPGLALGDVADEQTPLDRGDVESPLVRVPAGTSVSSVDRTPRELDAFDIDRYPVTNREWASFVRAGQAPPAHWPNGEIPPDREDHPVVGVSNDDAIRFAATRGMRLPTEYEWERAITGPRRADAVVGERVVSYVWPDAPLHMQTRAVTAPSRPGPFGTLHLGLVWEWTSTRLGNGHAIRGGYNRLLTHPPTAANRKVQSGTADDVGFRCVRPVRREVTGSTPYR